MTDCEPMPILAPVRLDQPFPITAEKLVGRLRVTLISAGYAVSFLPSLLLAVLTVLWVCLIPALGLGVVLALLVVPAVAGLTSRHREVSGQILGSRIEAGYRPTDHLPVLVRPIGWLRDPARWRDLGFLGFSATGGLAMSLLPVALLSLPPTWFVLAIIAGGWAWLLFLVLSAPALAAWWFVTLPLVRARALAEQAVLGGSRVGELRERVEKVEVSRSETLDHSAAEVRRIERDLHDGAQARIASVGMSVGLAEKLVHSDPEAAAALLREARESTVSALDDLRSVVRGIHPPVLADRGLTGAVEALALALPVPVSMALDIPRLPEPVESAAYFAVAECLANTAKHAQAGRAWVAGSHDGHRLRLTVGDDGRGGADPRGSGLAGIRRRLDAFDGEVRVLSPAGGPTVVELEVPCRTR